MATEVKIPVTGYDVTEGNIVEWLKQEGERVEEGEAIVTIETQKATVELPSPCAGVLRKILVERGQPIREGDTIAVVADPEENIDDLLLTLSPGKSPDTRTQEAAAPEPEVQAPLSAHEEVIPLTGARKRMADHMLRSKSVAAHGTTFNEADVSNALKLVKESNKEINFTALLVKAVANALREFPLMNSSSTPEKIVIKKYYHIGLAVNTEAGLIVPVVKDGDKKNLREISREIHRLTEGTEKGTLAVEDVQGGTFTISNGGRFGSLFFVPIINQPQSAILGAGKIERRPVVVGDDIVIQPMMYIFVSYDHRIIPGAVAQQFLSRVRQEFESFGA
jgi:pyruvate/2-oxoglutarate dehydrogenase complex dihydrolipoamide acyltransferase (E2) component